MKNSNQIKSRLKLVLPLIREASEITRAIVDGARMLLDEKEREELLKLSLEIGSLNATIESKLGQFQRLSVGSKRFAVVAGNRVNETIC